MNSIMTQTVGGRGRFAPPPFEICMWRYYRKISSTYPLTGARLLTVYYESVYSETHENVGGATEYEKQPCRILTRAPLSVHTRGNVSHVSDGAVL